MSQNMNVTRPRYRRTHSLDSTDSLESLEAQYYRQQFLATRAKFNHDQVLPSTPKPRAVRTWPSASQNHRDNAQLLLVPPTNQMDACSTLSYTSKTSSSVPSGDKFDAKTTPLPHEQSCSVTPLSETIQRFTSEIMNSEIPSMELQSQLSVKESLDSETSDGTHSSWEATAGSFSQTPMVSPTFRGNATHHDTLQPVVLAAPLQIPNLLKQTETLDQHSDIESDVILCHLSDSWLHPSSAEPLVQESLVTNTDTFVSQRAISLQTPPTYVTDSEALETDINTPVCKQVNTSLTAIPFRSCERAKLPVTIDDKTDEAQSQISLLPSSTFEMVGSSTQPTSAAEPLLMTSSLFHSYPVKEGSSSHGASISSLPHLRHQEQRLSDVSTDQNLSSERSARQAIQPKNAPNEMAMKGYPTQPSVVQPCLTSASSFHSYHMTERSTSNGASVSSLPFLKSQEQRINDPSRVQNLSSERFTREVFQPQTTPNIPLSPQKQNDSVDFVSNDESENKHKRSNSHFNSNGQFVRRPGTSSFRTSFQRRSQTPSTPVKLLIKKFSANN